MMHQKLLQKNLTIMKLLYQMFPTMKTLWKPRITWPSILRLWRIVLLMQLKCMLTLIKALRIRTVLSKPKPNLTYLNLFIRLTKTHLRRLRNQHGLNQVIRNHLGSMNQNQATNLFMNLNTQPINSLHANQVIQASTNQKPAPTRQTWPNQSQPQTSQPMIC